MKAEEEEGGRRRTDGEVLLEVSLGLVLAEPGVNGGDLNVDRLGVLDLDVDLRVGDDLDLGARGAELHLKLLHEGGQANLEE